jgi:hypothetical protein
MKNDNSFKDIASLYEGCLSWLYNMICDRIQSVCSDLGKNLETDIQEANRSILLDPVDFLCFQNQCDDPKIQTKNW